VLEQRQDVHFVVAGGGPLAEELEQLARDLGIEESVTFTGYIRDQSLVPVYLSLLTVFWLATRYEGFGLVYTEANAMGVPVIGSKIAPVDYVIGDSIGGLLADPDSPVDFAHLCLRLLDNKDQRQRLARQGASRGHQLFDINTVNQRIVDLYLGEAQQANL
jgi:glycosyltransferase involved in cell wall biosynthesis